MRPLLLCLLVFVAVFVAAIQACDKSNESGQSASRRKRNAEHGPMMRPVPKGGPMGDRRPKRSASESESRSDESGSDRSGSGGSGSGGRPSEEGEGGKMKAHGGGNMKGAMPEPPSEVSVKIEKIKQNHRMEMMGKANGKKQKGKNGDKKGGKKQKGKKGPTDDRRPKRSASKSESRSDSGSDGSGSGGSGSGGRSSEEGEGGKMKAHGGGNIMGGMAERAKDLVAGAWARMKRSPPSELSMKVEKMKQSHRMAMGEKNGKMHKGKDGAKKGGKKARM